MTKDSTKNYVKVIRRIAHRLTKQEGTLIEGKRKITKQEDTLTEGKRRQSYRRNEKAIL